MRFKDLNLEVVNVERYSSDYSMTVNKNFVTFGKGIVQALEYPAHVRCVKRVVLMTMR